ncbi:MAG: hypothetical protein GQ574_18675 [Crocinitomix sp.]|nr:hypothetical protein [Crocinitomix sp.]
MKKKGTFILAAFFVTGILGACSNMKETTEAMDISGFNLGDTTSIGLNDIVLCNDDVNLFVQFDTIVSDSRCPIDANCIWAGNAEVGFSVTYNKELENMNLNTNSDMETSKSVFGFTFKLLNVNPYPGSEGADSKPKSVDVVVTKD